MKNFVVNLKRQPEKYEKFLRQNAASGVAFERFDASDGAEMSEQNVAAMKIVAPGAKLTRGAIGCGASHFRIWKQTVETGVPALLPSIDGWDIFVLGYNTDSVLDLELARGMNSAMVFTPKYPNAEGETAFQKSNAAVGAFRLNHCFGTSGYAVSPAGAKKLLRFCFPMDNRPITIPALKRSFPAYGLDCMLNDVYKNIEAYACFSPLVLPRNDRAASTVQK